jgi:diacylglycerol kinase
MVSIRPSPFGGNAGYSTTLQYKNFMKSFTLSRIRSFGYAFRGWWHVLRTQQNAWIHAVISSAVILLSLWLGLSAHDWAVLLLTIAMVWAAEFFNTAIEAVVDLASPVQHPLAEVGKDVGAAAVLIAALAAIGVGLLIMGPPLWEKVGNWFGQAPLAVRSEATAFKGMELYSWQSEAGEWQFAILVGTNRNKTLDEVQAAPLDLPGVKEVIGRMAVGESLFWMQNTFDEQSGQLMTLPFPPEAVTRELREFAREKGVDIYIP